MPSKPLRPCHKQGCPNLTRDKYCEDHISMAQQEQRQRDIAKAKAYDKKRGSPTARGYDYKWQQYRIEFLKRNPQCVVCGAPSTIVDHVIPHKGNKGLFWTRFNHQALCKSCHDRKTATQDGGFGRQG
jgi:5-methylcytosine-specific restriction protein A